MKVHRGDCDCAICKALETVVSRVLAYKPKPKSKAAKKRKRRRAKHA